MRNIILTVGALVALTGCASQQGRDALTAYQWECQTGNAQACLDANKQAEINHSEATVDAGNVALTTLEVVGVIALIPLYILAGGGDDDGGDTIEIDEYGHRHVVHHPHPVHWHR